jgi:enoyl-CoA hydratase
MTGLVTYVVEENVARITLDDGKVNAMHLGLFEALGAALDRAERELPGALVIVGRPGFYSAGLDLKRLPALPPAELKTTLVAFGRIMLRLFTFPIPTVAAMTGHGVAGGALLGFACDLRFVGQGAFRIQMNEVAIGLTLPSWALAICQAAIPSRWHTEALLHARAYTPDEALERGIVHGVSRPAELVLDDATAAARSLGALDQKGYAISKARLREAAVRWASDRLEAEMVALPVKGR